MLCQLLNGRGAVELDGELLDDLVQTDVEVLQRPRDLDRPALVPEVALDLAENGGCGVGGEFHPAGDVETVDRLDQTDRAHLNQVLDRLAPGSEAARETANQGKVPGDGLLTGRQICVLVDLSLIHI